jgi:hypothetical protein
MASERFIYPPLPGPKHIRLLRLHSAPNPDDPNLSVELVPVPLEEAPPFEALSYTWGNPSPQTEIRCCGQTAKIGPSLYSALRHLRHSTRGQIRLMWADALCINQEDIPERNAQVRIMGDIYNTAASTVIWLGEADEYVTRAFGCLGRLHEAFGTHFGQGQIYRTEQNESIPDRLAANDNLLVRTILQAAFGDAPSQLGAFRDIWAMLRRPWFQRKWVIQEVDKTKPLNLVFWTSSMTLPRVALHSLFVVLDCNSWVVAHFFRACPWRFEAAISGKEHPLLCYQRTRLLTGSVNHSGTLVSFLARTLVFQCADPRDQIIALLGIATDHAAFDHLIDYHISVQELCARFARACLHKARDLAVMWSLLSISSPKTQLPNSWVLDIQELASQPRRRLMDAVDIVSDFYMSSDTPEITEITAFSNDNVLWIKGRIIGSIEELVRDISGLTEMPAMLVTIDSREDFQKINSHLDRWIDECHVIAEHADQDDDSFHCAMLCKDLVKPAAVVHDMVAAHNKFTAYRQSLKACLEASEGDPWNQALSELYSLGCVDDIESILWRMAYRRFGRTGDGALGWMPRAAEPGDCICIFDGMAIPYAIRPTGRQGGSYVLVGECLISSMIPDEAKHRFGVESVSVPLE